MHSESTNNRPLRAVQFRLWMFFAWIFCGAVALALIVSVSPQVWSYWPQYVGVRMLLVLCLVPVVGMATARPWQALLVCVGCILLADAGWLYMHRVQMSSWLARNFLLVGILVSCPVAVMRGHLRAAVCGVTATLAFVSIHAVVGITWARWTGPHPGGLEALDALLHSLVLFASMVLSVITLRLVTTVVELCLGNNRLSAAPGTTQGAVEQSVGPGDYRNSIPK